MFSGVQTVLSVKPISIFIDISESSVGKLKGKQTERIGATLNLT